MPVKSYRDLKVWQVAVDLVTEVYRLTAGFPRNEAYGLSSQIQRAAVSIPSNIAEGHARNSDKEFNHFLGIALGSLAELETQLIIAERLGFIEKDKVQTVLARCDEIGKMIRGLKKALKAVASC
jgi:four helix bundle protein